MNEFVREGDKIYVNVPFAEAYIPAVLFKENEETSSTVATRYGEAFKVMGIMNMRFFDSEDAPRESAPVRTFSYPNMIMTFPSDSLVTRLQLNDAPGAKPEPYWVLQYHLGDVMMNAEEMQSEGNCTKLLNMITMGKIPNTIPYDVFVSVWEANFDINGFNPQVPSVVPQMIWAEMCRDPNDMTKPFRYIFGKGGADPTHYVETNMNNVASATSVFSALSFERIKPKLATSMNMTRNGAEQRRSPIEEVLSM